MAISHVRYMCFPSVVKTGEKTTVYIRPRDISRIFINKNDWTLGIVGLFDDQTDYHKHVELDHAFEIKDGCMVFEHTFEKEQEYSVRFCKTGEKEQRIPLYAVEADLYELRALKGDLHTHSYYSDGADGTYMTPADYREEGFDFFSLTDHNRMYTSEYAAKLYDGVKLGMNIMRGEEVHTPGSLLHIVNVGGKESTCDKYILDREQFEKDVAEIEKTLTDVDENYRHRVALAKYACADIRKNGGLAILAHPFWCPNRYNVDRKFLDYIYTPELFDAFEVIGGINYESNNMQVALWQEKAFEGKYLTPVGSSDSHNHDTSRAEFTKRITIVFAKDNTTESIIEAVKNGMTVAGEIPEKDTDEVRFYGKLRLVTFAHFMYNNYFNETRRLCFGEGILMRRYAEGEDVADTLSSLCDTVDNFYKQFYGRQKPCGLTKATLEALADLRRVQIERGPETKGSNLYIYGGNERRV